MLDKPPNGFVTSLRQVSDCRQGLARKDKYNKEARHLLDLIWDGPWFQYYFTRGADRLVGPSQPVAAKMFPKYRPCPCPGFHPARAFSF